MSKICFLADADSIHTRKWVDYFSNLDNEIFLISMRDTSYQYKDNVKVIVVEPPFSSKLSYFFIIRQIKNIILAIKPDIMHCHYATSYGLFGMISKYHPFILSVWGSDVYEFPKGSVLKKKFLSYILNGADMVCSTSNDMARETRKYSNKKEIIITPFGVDIDDFNIKSPILSNNYITIGVVKNLKKIYGIEYLIMAFSDLLKETKKDIRLMIVGQGDEKENLEKLVKTLEISSKVTFTGNIDNLEVADFINKMDIVCIPSLSESFGVSAVEACACGRPLVSTNVGGLKEIVIDNYNGYTVNPGNSDLLREKLKILIDDEDRLKLFSKNARKLVMEKYNWKENAKIMSKLYSRITTGVKD